jgi:hypothetical protein
MSFPEADDFNAIHGTKFIADLMPRTPIYVKLLPDSAKAVIGQPHPSGRAAMKMLEAEGFVYDRYIDIFDGGPTVVAPTDQIRTLRQSRIETVSRDRRWPDRNKMLVAAGRLERFSRLLRIRRKRGGRGFDPRPRGRRASGSAKATRCWRCAVMPLTEINFDGIVGPTHNYAGLSLGNLASTANVGQVSEPRAAALQGIEKMRAKSGARPGAGHIPAPPAAGSRLAGRRSERAIEDAEPPLAANAMSASAMWAANAATVSPSPDTADGKCHLTVANLRTMPHRATNGRRPWRSSSLAFRDPPSPCTAGAAERSATRARPTTCGWPRPWRAGHRAVRLRSERRPFPARQHSEASKAIARLHRLDPERSCSSSNPKKRSPPARSTTTWSRSPTSGSCSLTKGLRRPRA